MLKPCEVRDGSRLVRFQGELLGSVSSERASSPRWTEKALYRTEQGTYVVASIGRTRVIHNPGCPTITSRLNRFVDEYPNVEPTEPRWNFHSCVGEEFNLDTILIEETRYGASISSDLTAIINNLYRETDGVRFLPRLSTDLLDQASEKDPAVAAVYRTEHIA